jgi:hypothetical protein
MNKSTKTQPGRWRGGRFLKAIEWLMKSEARNLWPGPQKKNVNKWKKTCTATGNGRAIRLAGLTEEEED